MRCNSYNKFFEVMSNKVRLSIIESLLTSDKCVSEICADINQEQSKVSHNLKILHDCYIVGQSIDGKKRVYSLNKETILPIIKLVNQHVKSNCKEGCHMNKGE
jgi:DNA-binding transcriptional ArsR family regulator